MNSNEVIDAFVRDVMRRVPARDRNDIGVELRGLLAEMLQDRAQDAGRPVDDAMTLDMLRAFGTPAEVATRYQHQSPGVVIIPPEQTRAVVLWSLIGMGVQWALTLPRVFDGQPLVSWWFGAGLGAFWWPGFIVVMLMIGAGLRHMGWYTPKWTPRIADPDRVQPGLGVAGLVGIAAGAIFMTSLPWLATTLPEPFPRIFAFDPDFYTKAWPAVVLWICSLGVRLVAVRRGRWTKSTRQLDLVFALGFTVMMAWWIASGPIFVETPTDQGAKGALALVLVITIVSTAVAWYRERAQIKPIGAAG